MIIRVNTAGQVAIDDHDVFTDFHVQASSELVGNDLAATMGEDTRVDGEYLWVAEAAIRLWSIGQTDKAWDDGFSAMVDYARSRGWTNPAGTHLRAHVDYA